MLEYEDDFPTVGLTGFDAWINSLCAMLVVKGFVDIMDFPKVDREHWKQYYDIGYTVEEAFEEDLTAYGD